MVGWCHWFSGHEFEQTPGDGEGQGSLVCSSPWGRKELDITEWLNNNENIEIRRRNCSNEELYFSLFICFSNWRIITLQYCDAFALHWHEWAIGYIMSPLSLDSPSHSLPFPSLWSQTSNSHWLSLLHGNVHISMLFSQIPPSSSFPTVSESLFFISVSPLLPCM